MAKQRKELDAVKQLLREYPGSSAGEIAEHVHLDASMGIDKATDYVKAVRRRMRKAGELDRPSPTEAELLQDLQRLLDLRDGKMSRSAQRYVLMLYCYWNMRAGNSEEIDLRNIDQAISKTYDLNRDMKKPLHPAEELKAAEIAMEYYDRSMDPEKNAFAAERGLPNAGLNYSIRKLLELIEVTVAEEAEMQYLKRPRSLPKER